MSKQPTVCHLITGLGTGGAERMITRLVSQHRHLGTPRHVVVSLLEEGFEVNGPRIRNAGVEVHCLGMRRSRPSLIAYLRAVRLLKQLRPDVVMTWLYHADLLGTLAAPLAGVTRLIWNIRCSEVNFDWYAKSTRWTTKILARLSHRPWAVATNSTAGQRAHEALGYAPRRWLYLPNGFDLDEWYPDAADRAAVRRELGLHPTNVVLVMVARVDPIKDHGNLLAAASYLIERRSDMRLVLIGRGTDSLAVPPKLAGALLALGERPDVPRLLRGFDIAVLSSTSEGFPNTVGEAMATALPCVVTDVGDTKALVDDTGVVVSPRDSMALAVGIEALIAEGPQGLKRRGQMARERIAAGWSIERAIKAYDSVWREALALD